MFSKKMTLKMEMAVSLLKKNGYNIGKSMREAGYTKNTADAGPDIARLRKAAVSLWTEEKVRKQIEQHRKHCVKKEDNSNVSRMLELKTKCLGMQRDVKENLTPDTLIIIDRTTPIASERVIDSVGDVSASEMIGSVGEQAASDSVGEMSKLT